MKKLILNGLIATMLLATACGQNKETRPKKYGQVYVKMTVNGNPALNATADSPLDQSALVSARITSKDITLSGQTMAKNTLIIGATAIIDQESGKTKTLSLSIPDVTAPGTYRLVEKGGLFVYSDASGGMSNLVGYAITESEDGSCTVTITKIGEEPIASFGRIVRGTFTATVNNGEVVHTLKGSFNGGIRQ